MMVSRFKYICLSVSDRRVERLKDCRLLYLLHDGVSGENPRTEISFEGPLTGVSVCHPRYGDTPRGCGPTSTPSGDPAGIVSDSGNLTAVQLRFR